MRTSLIAMLVMGVLACAGLGMMMNHLKGVVSSDGAGFEPLIQAIAAESATPPALIVENHDGLRVLRIGVEPRAGEDARALARRIGDLAWQKVGSIQSLDGVFVDWKGQGGGSLEVKQPLRHTPRGPIAKARAAASRPAASRPGSRPRETVVPPR
jgi:hypothetical protein